MSAILMTVPDGGGTVPPDLSVASALRRRGHQVRVLSDPVLRPEVEAAGAEHVPWTRAPHRLDRSLESEIIRDWEARTPMGGFAQMRDRIACGPAADYAGDVVAELARMPADAVVTDFVLPGAMIAAEAAGLPLVILGTTIYPFPVPGVPPMGPGFMPAHGTFGRARDGVLAALTRRMWDRGLPAINAARAGVGLAPVTAVTDVYDRADRFLVLTSEAFEFPSSGRPANVRYVGPRLDDPAWTDSWVPPAGDRPLVLVALSSTHQGQVAMLSRVAEAFSGLRRPRPDHDGTERGSRGGRRTSQRDRRAVRASPAGARARRPRRYARRSRDDDQGAEPWRAPRLPPDGTRPERRCGASRRRRGRRAPPARVEGGQDRGGDPGGSRRSRLRLRGGTNGGIDRKRRRS